MFPIQRPCGLGICGVDGEFEEAQSAAAARGAVEREFPARRLIAISQKEAALR